MADTTPTTTDTDVTTTDDPTTADTTTDTPDLAAELARWKSEARKHEQRAKSNAAAAEKLAKIEEASKSELERAQAAATAAEERAKAAEERIARALTRAAVSAAAVKAGAIDADAVLALLPADAVTVDGEDVPEAKTEGLSHEVGSGELIDGLDEAVTGLKAGDMRLLRDARRAGSRLCALIRACSKAGELATGQRRRRVTGRGIYPRRSRRPPRIGRADYARPEPVTLIAV